MRKLIALVSVAALLGIAAVAAQAHLADPKTFTVKVRDDKFIAPSGLTTKIKIHRGHTIKFSWPSAGTQNEHNVYEENGKFGFLEEKRTGSYKKKFKKAGTWYVICTVHTDTMRMKITVKE